MPRIGTLMVGISPGQGFKEPSLESTDSVELAQHVCWACSTIGMGGAFSTRKLGRWGHALKEEGPRMEGPSLLAFFLATKDKQFCFKPGFPPMRPPTCPKQDSQVTLKPWTKIKSFFVSNWPFQTFSHSSRNLCNIGYGGEFSRFSFYVTHSRCATKEHNRNPDRLRSIKGSLLSLPNIERALLSINSFLTELISHQTLWEAVSSL